MTQLSPWKMKGVALQPLDATHCIDHLAVISHIMNIPYLFFDEKSYELATRYYPGISAQLHDYHLFPPELLFSNYDVSFMSDLWDRNTIQDKFAGLQDEYHKIWRNVHVPHGFSDKSFYLSQTALEDITLMYGHNMIDLIKACNQWENVHSYVITGNYRYTYYLQNRDFYEKIFQDEIQSKFDKKRPILLYAPTWVDSEQSSSFFKSYTFILDHLPDEYNLIVKLHPRLELDDIANFHRIIGSYENKKNVCFLTDFTLVFPILANTDIYIGDMSSIGYDFLIFNKPLILLNNQNRDPKTDRRLFLSKCSTVVKPDQFLQLFQIIDKCMRSEDEDEDQKRADMWNYTFGPQRPLEEIKRDIMLACEDSTKLNNCF